MSDDDFNIQVVSDLAGLKGVLQALLIEVARKGGFEQQAIEHIRTNAIDHSKKVETIYWGNQLDPARAEFTVNDLFDRIAWESLRRSK